MAPHATLDNNNTTSGSDSTTTNNMPPPRRRNNASRGWIVQKFGGTSVGKFPEQIAENIVG